jgi:hypothetical protein
LIFNGDFSLPKVKENTFAVYSSRIPGWISSEIVLGKSKNGQNLILNNKNNKIHQIVSYG